MTDDTREPICYIEDARGNRAYIYEPVVIRKPGVVLDGETMTAAQMYAAACGNADPPRPRIIEELDLLRALLLGIPRND